MSLWDEDPASPPVSLTPDIEEKLREHGPYLIERLELNELFWAEMSRQRVLSDLELRDLKSFQLPSTQNDKLTDKLHCVPVYKFHRFLQCLHATGQDDIIRTLGFNPEDYPNPMTRKDNPMRWHCEVSLEDGSKCDKIIDGDSKFCSKCGSAAVRVKSCSNCSKTLSAEPGNFCGNCKYAPKQQSTLGPSQTPSQAASSLVRVPVHQEANLQTSYIDHGGIQDKITMVRDENSEGIYEVIDDPTVDEQMASLYLSPIDCQHGEQHPSIDPNCTPDTLLPRDQTLKQDQQRLQGFPPQNPKGKGDEIPQLPLVIKRDKPLKKIWKVVCHPFSALKKKISKKKPKKPAEGASAMSQAESETMPRKGKPMTWHHEGSLEDGSKCDKIPDVDSKFFFKSGSAAERYRSCPNCNKTLPAETGDACGNCRYNPKQQSIIGPSQTPSQAASSLVRVPVHQEANLQTSYIDHGGIQDENTMVREDNTDEIHAVINDPTVDEQMASSYLCPVDSLHEERHPGIDPNWTPDTLLPADQTLKQDQQHLQGFPPQNPKGKGDEIPQKLSKKKPKKPAEGASAISQAESETMPRLTTNILASNILEHLGLTDYYPRKISLQMAMALCPDTAGNKEGLNQNFAMQFLRKLIMLDYTARDQDSSSTLENEKYYPQTQGGMCASGGDFEPLSSKAEDSIEKLLSDMTDGEDQSLLLNPVDTFLTIFHCCDLMLRQVVAHKMFMCRLAVPFIVPDLFDDSYSLALWALRDIVVEWKMQSQETCECSVVSTPLNIMSFVRVGRPHYSKSKLMNMILSDHGHNTFCNVDSPHGNRKHMISESLVETAWFLPAGKETDVFKNATMLLNLRGDASKCKQSIEVLSKISDVMVVCVCPTDLTDKHTLQTLVDIHKKCSRVIVFFVEKDIGNLDITNTKKQLKSYETHIGEEEKKNRVIVFNFKGQKERNLFEIKQEMAKAFAETIPMRATKSLEDACKAMNDANYSIDEMDTACQRGKFLSEKVMKFFPQDRDIKKSDLLPIQACWVEWSKLLKEQRRSKGATTIMQKENLKSEMTNKREEQVKICKNLIPVVERFLSGLTQANNIEEIHFFLQWLKLFFDGKSREILPALRKKLTEIRRIKGSQSKEARAATQQIKDSSLGLEHFFREIGQIYEAFNTSKMDVDQNTRRTIESLPDIIGRLVYSGYPLEIMDGDASNVPMIWLKAVFSSVKKFNTELVVLSVLGIQSSGKSTLLNTMFGLRFAVSAGRCTHGVYAQLISTQGAGSSLPFQQVLVVDTEGLRAPELAMSEYHHDNELATFVVGLGDMTIVNIKGENVEEVKDILQIVAHAFLRMKLVSKGSEHQKTCMFVHQNVNAIDATSKMMNGSMTMTDTLDKLVEEAAITEGQGHIQTFSQVLAVDLDKQMWCLSDLFIGDPPMAPVNPGYSESVQKIKTGIIKHASESQSEYADFTDLTDRLETIWDAILSEDFVFSFRNSRAARAYAALDGKYSNLHWEFETDLREWKYNTAKPKLEACSTLSAIQNVCHLLRKELQDDFSLKIAEACEKLEEFFQGEWKNILIQWQTEKLTSLRMVLSKLVEQTETYIVEMKNSLSFDIKQNANHERHVQEIIAKAQQLARKLKGQANESTLKQDFEMLWTEWVSSLPMESEIDDIDICLEVEKALRDCFQDIEKNNLVEELKCQTLSDKLDTLVGSFKLKTNESKEWYKPIAWMLPQNLVKGEKTTADTPFIDHLLKSITGQIQIIVSRNVNFEGTFAKDIINYIIKECKDKCGCALWESDFRNLSKLQVQLAVLACRYAIPHFTAMHDRYKNKNSIKMKIEEHKLMTYKIYEHSVKQSANEVLAADLIMNESMESSVKLRVIQDLDLMISNQIRSEIGCTKYILMVKILKYLASHDNFLEYMEYVYDSKVYAHKWVHIFGNDMFFNGSNKFFEFAKAMVQTKISYVEEAIMKATERASYTKDEQSKTNVWLSEFSKCLKVTVNLNTEEMQLIRKYTFADVFNLQTLLLEHLKEMEKKLLEYFQNVAYEAVEWGDTKPYDHVCDSLWGCNAQCPFCKETCQKTVPNHSEAKGDCHECLQHRPKGVSSMRWVKSKMLVVENCSFGVHVKTTQFPCKKMKSKCTESAHDTDEPCHPFGEYKTAFPDWDIAPSADMGSSKYWMWFVAKYQDELTNYYKVQKPNIPASWFDITQEEAVASLATAFSGQH